MSTTVQIQQLRNSAHLLRSLSTSIGRSRAITVHALAGPDTWIGPTAQSCYDELLAVRRLLLTNQESLVDTANRIERRANELEQLPSVLKLVS
ncbi:MAG TPA: hypothetical protein VFE86_11075 [Ilumatobacteraceae bacterium]|nr:hypothetical protein [Ilumatobacteraceae bacterium]